MIKKDFHIHSTYCDGENTPKELVKQAISLGMDTIGILSHSYTPFDLEPCIKKENIPSFVNEIIYLKSKYRNDIEVLLGSERDYYSEDDNVKYDYIIGSVHYLKIDDKYYAVDDTVEILKECCQKCFNGDYYALCEKFFELEADVVSKTNCTIIGHFDLITKFNEQYHLFDESNPRYISAWKKAIDALIPYNIPFEINLGGITRKKKTTPYPSLEIISYIKEHGGKLILNSDAHNKENILKYFDKYEYLL